MCLGKIGCTVEPHGRLSTYLTGCPPGLTHDIEYDAIWETTATTRDELFDFEDEVHNNFIHYRAMRNKPGDSEWFNFQGKHPCDEVTRFMESRPWVRRRVPLSEIFPPKQPLRYLRKQFPKNLKFIKEREARNAALNFIQEPVVSAISAFVADAETNAGYVIAPCGSGKTIMTVRGIRGLRKCVICCPSKQIQLQWQTALLAEGVFSASQIHTVGSSGTTDPLAIREFFEMDAFCIISTYMSSHKLVEMLNSTLELIILDEAHHMAGIVAECDTGEGRTRRLMLKASELGIKRLSLTFTPRFIADCTDAKYLTMDDRVVFGTKIAELKLRDLIRKGVLPDYRLWLMRDESQKGNGILGKAACILEAWAATEIVRGEERFIQNHLIVFAATTQEAKEFECFFKERAVGTHVLRVEEGDALETPIALFTAAPRAILINCFVLNEGVDIPIADSVAITYPKQSRGQITQMVLRAGRWFEGKPIFHVILPTLGDEDLSGIEEVLSALASCDEQIRDEIVFRTKSGSSESLSSSPSPSEKSEIHPECIMIEEFEAHPDEILRCFRNIRRNIFQTKDSRRIQDVCIQRHVDTSIEYELLRREIPELPDNPLPKDVTWYDYLHPTSVERLSCRDFVKTILETHNLRVAHAYDEWREAAELPTVQHITDGYFGKDDTNFNLLREKYGKKMGRGR